MDDTPLQTIPYLSKRSTVVESKKARFSSPKTCLLSNPKCDLRHIFGDAGRSKPARISLLALGLSQYFGVLRLALGVGIDDVDDLSDAAGYGAGDVARGRAEQTDDLRTQLV